MVETTAAKPKAPRKPAADKPAAAGPAASDTAPKARFAAAVEEARAGAKAMTDQAYEAADTYRKMGEDWLEDAKGYSDQAMERAGKMANEGKAKTTEALGGLSKIVSDNASAIDDKFGAKYGDYARGAAKSIQDAADKLDAKDFAELGDDARDMIRKSPGLAIGLAAAAGFMFARMFSGGKDD